MALNFQNYTFIGEKFASGGINLKWNDMNLADNESPNCKNVMITRRNAISSRTGYVKLNQDQVNSNPESCLGLYQMHNSDGTDYLLSCWSDGVVYTGTTILTATAITGQDVAALYDFAALNDWSIIVNGVDPNWQYDGTNAYELGIDAPVAAPTDGGAAAGAMAGGNYQWMYTFVDAYGNESNPSPASASIVVINGRIINIAVSADPQVVDRNIYRTTVGPGGVYYFAGSAGDNTAVTYTDLLNDTGLGTEVDYDNDKPPIFRYVATHKNRLFGVDAVVLCRLWISKEFQPGQAPLLNFIDISPDDGDIITGIVSFFDQLVIFKRNSIYVLSGNTENEFAIQRAATDSRIGCVAFRTAKVVDNRLFFLSERGVYAFDGLRTQYLSERIEPAFDRNTSNTTMVFNWVQESLSCALNYKNGSRNWYILAVPTGSETHNSYIWIYDYVLDYWAPFDRIYPDSMAIVTESNEPRWYTGNIGFIWRQDDTYNDGYVHYPSYSTSNINLINTLEDLTAATIHSFATAGGAATLTDFSLADIASIATGGGVFTLTDNTLTMTVNEHAGKPLYISAGTSAGDDRVIVSNTVDTFTVSVAFTFPPDATSIYQVGGMVTNVHVGKQLYIRSGTSVGDVRTVASNTHTVFTVGVNFTFPPDITSEYTIGGFPMAGDGLLGVGIKLLDGPGKGSISIITANTSVDLTVAPNWSAIPTTLTKYSIGFIEAQWDSKWFHYNAPEYVKRLNYIHTNTDRELDYDLKVGLRFDFFSGDPNTDFIPLDLSGSSSIWDASIWDVDSWDSTSKVVTRLSVPYGRIHRYVQASFYNDAGDQPYTVNSFDLVYQVKGIRR